MKMTLAQKVLYNVGSQAAGRVVGLVLALLTIRITTNYLGVDGYGDLAIVLALTGLLVSLTDFGITTVLARETAKAPEEADLLGGALLRLRITSAAATVCVAIALLPFLPYPQQVKAGLVIGLIGTFFLSVGRFPNAFFQVHLRMDLLAVLDVLYKLATIAFVAVVVLLNLGFYALVTALTLASFIWFVSSFLVSRRFWSINVRRTRGRMQTLVRDSFGVWLVTIVGLLHFQGDMVLLSLLKPPSEVGIYAIAYKFIEQSFLVPGLLMSAIFPILVRRMEESREQSEALIRRAFVFLFLVGLSLALMMFIMADQLVSLIASEEFAPAAKPLRVVSLALPVIFASMIFFNVLIALNRQRMLILVSLFSLVLNIALNLYFIPRYSYIGAAWATVATETVAFLGLLVMARRAYSLTLEAGLMGRMAVSTGSAILIAAATARFPPLVSAAAALAAFFLAAVATRIVTRAELKLLVGR